MDSARARCLPLGCAHAALVTIALLAPPVAAAEPAARLAASGKCLDDGRFVCGSAVVPLDHSGGTPGTVRLSYALHERVGDGEPTVVFLMGGPGQAGLPYKTAIDQMTDSIPARNLLVLDQRGIGESDPLRCPGIDNRFRFTPGRIRACSDQLGDRARFHTSMDTVHDLEALRRALGIPAYTLFGISYGTYVAQLYARTHPLATERLVLDSVVSSEAFDPFFHFTFQAIPRIVGNLCGSGGCAGISSDLRGDLDTLLARLEREPLRGTIYDGERRRRNRYDLQGDTLFGLVMGSDYEPRGYVRSALPAAIGSALAGDPQPLARLEERALQAMRLEPRISDAEFNAPAHLAAFCGDASFPWDGSVTDPAERERRLREAADARPADHFGRFPRSIALDLGAKDCTHWGSAGRGDPGPALPRALPALIVSGEEDARTPVEEAQSVLGLLPVNAWLLTVPGSGHSVFGQGADCAFHTLDAILYEISEAITRGCPPADPVEPLAPYPRSASSARAALRFTVGDIEALGEIEVLSIIKAVLAGQKVRTTTYWMGGLRDGSARMTIDPNHTERSRLRLTGFSSIPGLRLSGRLRMYEPNENVSYWVGKVRASGRYRGTLRFGKRAVTGTLRGRRVSVGRAGSSASLSRIAAARRARAAGAPTRREPARIEPPRGPLATAR